MRHEPAVRPCGAGLREQRPGAAREALRDFCRRYLAERLNDLCTLASLTLPPAALLHAGADGAVAAAATLVAAGAIRRGRDSR